MGLNNFPSPQGAQDSGGRSTQMPISAEQIKLNTAFAVGKHVVLVVDPELEGGSGWVVRNMGDVRPQVIYCDSLRDRGMVTRFRRQSEPFGHIVGGDRYHAQFEPFQAALAGLCSQLAGGDVFVSGGPDWETRFDHWEKSHVPPIEIWQTNLGPAVSRWQTYYRDGKPSRIWRFSNRSDSTERISFNFEGWGEEKVHRTIFRRYPPKALIMDASLWHSEVLLEGAVRASESRVVALRMPCFASDTIRSLEELTGSWAKRLQSA